MWTAKAPAARAGRTSDFMELPAITASAGPVLLNATGGNMGGASTFSFQVGANSGQTIEVTGDQLEGCRPLDGLVMRRARRQVHGLGNPSLFTNLEVVQFGKRRH